MLHPDLLLDTIRLEQARRLREAERLWAVRRRRRESAAAEVTPLPVRPPLAGDDGVRAA